MSNNGSTVLDQAMYIYANRNITNLLRIDTPGSGMVTIGLAATADDARRIKISIDGTAYYINARTG
ncbi:hypothetical protein ES708_10726 [subsurface metagenome]